MLDMTIGDVAAATGAEVVAGDPGGRVRSVARVDSREVRDGDVLACFRGGRADGNDYAAGAMRAGASCVAMTREPSTEELEAAAETGCAVLRAAGDDAQAFLMALAGEWRRRNPGWVVVAVTGSVGKTTTKSMLVAALSTCRRTHATEGNHNNLVGVPLTVLSASPGDEVLVLEMGVNYPRLKSWASLPSGGEVMWRKAVRS